MENAGKKMNHEEYTMCVACVKWSDQFFRIRHRDLLVEKKNKKTGIITLISPLVHVANEGQMSAKHGHQTNKIGRRAGFLDYLYPVPLNGFGGLYLEAKRDGKKITDFNQRQWYNFLKRFNRCEMFDSVRRFQEIVEDYFGV